MFANALKSFSSNITSNYTLGPQPTSIAGAWKIYDAKSKRTGKAASVFVFDRKSLDGSTGGGGSGGGLAGRGGGVSLKRSQDEVVERLKKEASSLARLRHPCILELAEPVEETTRGGLMFVSEPVVSSLAGLLQDQDEQARSGGRTSRYVVEESDGTPRRRELELDELEIQKGLLQLAKGLEFLHESAGLVHANLTPAAILINAKGDWKISGLAFCGPHESSTSATSITPISLHEVLNHDPRLPRSVQLNIDYTSPDFVLDNTLTCSADMFSLGLLIIALYNSPHTSPLSTGGSLSSFKRVFSSSSTIPSQNNNFLIPASHPIPQTLASEVLPRLITRRPAQRLTAKAFQEARYFDNILVSTMRFLDALPAKTQNEKQAFMRGLPNIMPQFPKSVLQRKVLPALLEEMKDKDLLALILSNVLAIVQAMPAGKQVFTERVVPKLREVFLANKTTEKDTSREGALIVLLEGMNIIAENCTGKEFRDDVLPIVLVAMDSTTHALVDAALSTLPSLLPNLDFSTIKNELFPMIAQVFAKTSSLQIKIRGLEAFSTLCGGGHDDGANDDLNGIGVPGKKASTSSIILDKYTIQEKVVPLLRGIKTKEPGVMMAALNVIRQVGEVADIDFLAKAVLPLLWEWSLGPLLNLAQFEAFMKLIKSMSGRIEAQQTKKLRELSSSDNRGRRSAAAHKVAAGGIGSSGELGDDAQASFEQVVSGRKQEEANANGDLMNDWNSTAPQAQASSSSGAPAFSWQATSAMPNRSTTALRQSHVPTRTVTPDLATFSTLVPSSQYSNPLQPQAHGGFSNNVASHSTGLQAPRANGTNVGLDWSAAATRSTAAGWSAQTTSSSAAAAAATVSRPFVASQSSFSIPPPPISPQALHTGYSAPPGSSMPRQAQQQVSVSAQPQPWQQAQTGGGLEKYESLL